MHLAVRCTLSAACLAAVVSLPAAAQTSGASSTGAASTTASNAPVTDTWRMPWQRRFWGYIGASAGGSDYDLDCVSGFQCDRRDVGFKVHAGGKLYNALGLEVAYVNFGRAEVADGKARAQAVNASLVAGLPLWGDRFGINGKVGTSYGWTRISSSIPGRDTGKESDWGLSYGVGATYALSRNTELRVDWDRYRFAFRGQGDQDLDLLSAGINFRF